MRVLTLTALALGAAALAPAQAATFDLTLNADNGSRFYEHRSDAYAELGKAWNSDPSKDGFFLISTNAAIGGGTVVFEKGATFTDIGQLSYNESTGAVTGLTLDFAKFIAYDDTVLSANGYSTSLSNVSGTVSLFNGAVSGITLNSNITFTFATQLGSAPYTGTFSFAGDKFTLAVDDTVNSPVGAFRYQWDVHGGVANLAPVPEPSTYALMAGGLLVVGAWSRRRSAQA